MKFPAVHRRMSAGGAVKINVHGYFRADPFSNGNRTGIGVVIRNDMGGILTLCAGSLRIEEQRVNENYAMFEGLLRAYYENLHVVELETDNVASYWEWTDSMIHGMPPEYFYIVQ